MHDAPRFPHGRSCGRDLPCRTRRRSPPTVCGSPPAGVSGCSLRPAAEGEEGGARPLVRLTGHDLPAGGEGQGDPRVLGRSRRGGHLFGAALSSGVSGEAGGPASAGLVARRRGLRRTAVRVTPRLGGRPPGSPQNRPPVGEGRVPPEHGTAGAARVAHGLWGAREAGGRRTGSPQNWRPAARTPCSSGSPRAAARGTAVWTAVDGARATSRAWSGSGMGRMVCTPAPTLQTRLFQVFHFWPWRLAALHLHRAPRWATAMPQGVRRDPAQASMAPDGLTTPSPPRYVAASFRAGSRPRLDTNPPPPQPCCTPPHRATRAYPVVRASSMGSGDLTLETSETLAGRCSEGGVRRWLARGQ